MFRNKCREFGIVLKTHGVKGELLIKTTFEVSDNYKLAESIFIKIDGLLVPFFIEEYSISNQEAIIIKLSDIDNKNKALKFVDCKIFVEGLKLSSKKFDFSNSDLIGFTVINEDDKKIGKITDFMDIPENFLIYVKYQNKEILIPFNEFVLIDFNKKKKQIILKIEKGLFEL